MDVVVEAVLLLGVVGLVFVVVGLRWLRTPHRVGWLTVPGVVVGWSGGGVDSAALAVVEYPLPDGTPHRFTNRTGVDLGFRRTGYPVTVLVDPEDVRHAELVGTTGQARLLGGIFTVLGLLVLVIGGAVVVGALVVHT